MKAIAQKLESIVGSTGVCDWENIEVLRREQMERALVRETSPSCIVYPNTQAELAEVIACAHRNNWSILPCGSGSKITWGGLASGVELVVSTERINQVIQHAVGDLTVTVEAGTKFADLQAILVEAGQFLALDPTTPESATIGGIVATADTGSLRQRYGGVRDQVLGITFVRADGQIAKAGGRVVKNVAGYDLMKLFTGSYGTLGIITQVTFRVYPLPEASATVVLTGDADAIAQVTTTQRSSALTPTAADLLSTQLVARLGIGRGLGLIARFQSVTESVKQQSAGLLEVGQQLGLQGAIYSAGDEAHLWQTLREEMGAPTTEPLITCKIGVLPRAAVATLTQLDSFAPQQGMGLIHAGSGLGLLRFDSPDVTQIILEMRAFCQSQSGFLTILEALVTLKQQLDVWGYSSNALDLMRRIKQQFDPKNLLSPHRFVGGI
jgi:glycolate oxidase FAD binding subunit